MTQYTTNYHLDLYEDSDKPNLRGQYNTAVIEIDKVLFALSNGQVSINNNIATLQQQVKTNETEIAENLAAITKINGDIDVVNAKLTTDEANITALQTGLESTNQNVAQTVGEVVTINGTLASHDTRITAAETNASNAITKATQAQQETATHDGYWNALGVSNLDEAVELNTDLQDVHTTTMVNQADIATIKTQLPLNDFVFTNHKTLTETTLSCKVLSNAAKTIFKVYGGGFTHGVNTFPTTIIPNSNNQQGIKLGNIADIVTLPDDNIYYNNMGFMYRVDYEHADQFWIDSVWLCLTPSGDIYCSPTRNATYATTYNCIILQQIPLSTHNSNTPVIPPAEPENA